jgi:hypothetical protein
LEFYISPRIVKLYVSVKRYTLSLLSISKVARGEKAEQFGEAYSDVTGTGLNSFIQALRLLKRLFG